MPNPLEENTLEKDASYEKALRTVAPGKLISTDLFKWIIERLRTLEERIRGQGEVVVPRVFGQTLSQALKVLDESTVDLQVGLVLDASGRTIDIGNSEVLGRTVIGQMPDAGTRTTSGDDLDLVVGVPEGTSNGSGSNGGAIGFIEVIPQKSPQGTNVVIGSDKDFIHQFKVRNQSDTNLSIDLKPFVTGMSAIDWSDAVEVKVDGSTASAINLGSYKDQVVDVVLQSPDALDQDDKGESLTLRLNASVGPPHELTGTGTVDLTVDTELSDPVTRTLEFDQVLFPEGEFTPSGPPTFTADLRYTADEDPKVITATYRVSLSNPENSALDDWDIEIIHGENQTSPSNGVEEASVQLDAGTDETKSVSTRIFPPALPAKVDVTLELEADVEGEALFASFGPNPLDLVQAES